jgi:1,6-anhydro-N-acetylmuramate kinase
VIAARTGIPTVSDFRVADMAVGGQGAPLVPFSEYLLYRREKETILLQNIGGIGNMTVLPAAAKPEEVYAFDTGPGNMIIDAVVTALSEGRRTFDEGGRLGAGGRGGPGAARPASAGALLHLAAAQNHGTGAVSESSTRPGFWSGGGPIPFPTPIWWPRLPT